MMQGAYRAMPEEDRMALEAWEAANTGGGVATSDWPGWEKYIGQPPWGTHEARKPGRPKLDEPPSPVASPKWGHIYVLRAANGLYKIGRAIDVDQRLRAYKTHSSEPLEMVLAYRVADMVSTEADWHARFGEKRQHGEWFALDETELAEIKRVGLATAHHYENQDKDEGQ